MEIFLIVLAVVLSLAGIVGSVLPALPGAPLNFLAILILYLAFPEAEVGLFAIIFSGLLAIGAFVVDYILPIKTAKFSGASRWGAIGAAAGLLIGLVILNFPGMIIGTFLGAVLGELLYGAQMARAVKSGWATFVGTMLAALVKVTISGALSIYFIWKLIKVLV